ncbi:MAG: hypothetical protein KR126chlam3_00561 [Chlamydiae bacterium]|nr:hypothetical protein [Chlamydiota bacterium]
MPDGTPSPDDVLRSQVTKPITEGEPQVPKQTVRPFQPYMEGGRPNPLTEGGKSPQISPFDLSQGQVPAAGPTFNTIQEQAKAAHATLGDIATQLKTPKLKLKQSTKYLLKNKLSSAKGHIKSASDKLGAPAAQEQEIPKGSGALQKFLGLITDGQNQLDATQQQIADIAAKGQDMRPADMLLVQIKLSKAQQELQYSSMLLGKAIDDLKQLMGIQL